MKIIILGINGMIGSSIFNELSKNKDLQILGTLRKKEAKTNFRKSLQRNIIILKNLNKIDLMIDEFKPEVLINCIGITKHRPELNNFQNTILINSIFPHNLNDICLSYNIKLIHISTDCVFLGNKGNYSNYDNTDPIDFYGKTKALGEICNDKTLTIRTSTIGHEFNTSYGLLEWFLTQKENCEGYKNAFFSGLTTLELSKIIYKAVLPNLELSGIYNVGGPIIDKFTLLNIFKEIYKKEINITINKKFVIDRSLNSTAFYSKTNYIPLDWFSQIEEMHNSYIKDNF